MLSLLATAVQALPSLFAYHLQYLTAELCRPLSWHINLIICVKITLFILVIVYFTGDYRGSFCFKAASLFLAFPGEETTDLA